MDMQWIKVTQDPETMPTLSDFVYSDAAVIGMVNGRIRPVWYERTLIKGKKVYRWKDRFDHVIEEPVTHWMSYPEPPED